MAALRRPCAAAVFTQSLPERHLPFREFDASLLMLARHYWERNLDIVYVALIAVFGLAMIGMVVGCARLVGRR